MTILGSNPRKPSSQSYAPSYSLFLLEKWISVCPRRSLQPRREIVSVSAIPVTVKASVAEFSDAVNAGMAEQTEACRLALSLKSRLQLALWFVGWSVLR